MPSVSSPVSFTKDLHWKAWLGYPLKPWLRGLVLLPGLIILTLALITPRLPFPIGGLLLMISTLTLWVLALRLAVRLLLAAADGAVLEREVRARDLPELQASRQIALWLLAAMLVGAGLQLAGWPGLLVALTLVWLALPGAIALTARENRLGALVEPAQWRCLLDRIGPAAYRHLLGLQALLIGAYVLADWLTAALPAWLSNGLMMSLWVYLLIVFYYAIGQVSQTTSEPDLEKPADSEQALQALKERLISSGGSLAEHARLARALELRGDRAAMLAHGPPHVAALLLAYQRPAAAVEQADKLIALDQDFTLAIPSAQQALIRAAVKHGTPELALALCRSFLVRFPAAPAAGEVRKLARSLLTRSP